MFKVERKITDRIIKLAPYFLMVLITVAAVVIRIDSRKFLSSDSHGFLIPWFLQIRNNGGLGSLKEQIGDYNLLYQTIIAFMTYLPNIGDDGYKIMYCYKILSCIFDFALAAVTAFTVCSIKKKNFFGYTFALVYSVVIFLPTVVMNSAQWAQCDSIYSTFGVLFIYFLYKEKYIPAFIFYGIAFAFKFQTIFLLPFVFAYYFYKKSFSILHILLSVFVFWLSGIFAYFNGRPLSAPFTIYFAQTNTYGEMFMNFPSIWQLFGDDYPRFKNFAMLLTLAICLIGFYIIVSGKKKIDNANRLLTTAIWFMWTCLLFLPAMHDRYAYLMDILILIAAFVDKRNFKYAFICILMSFKSYPGYLIFMEHLTFIDPMIYAFAWAFFTYEIFIKKDPEEEKTAGIEESEVKTGEISEKNA